MIDYDTHTGQIVVNPTFPCQCLCLEGESDPTLGTFSGPLSGFPNVGSYLSAVVMHSYNQAAYYAQKWRLDTITPEVVFICLWNNDKEILENFLNELGIDINAVMSKIENNLNCFTEYSQEVADLRNVPWYSLYLTEARLAALISNKMHIARALSVSIVSAFIISNNSVGKILNESNDFSLIDINKAFVSSISKHMTKNAANTIDSRKWALFNHTRELVWNPEYGEICILE